MTVRYQLTAEDYIALNRYLLQHDPAMRARIRALQLGGAAAVLALGAAVCRFALHGAYFPMMGLFALAAVLFALYADNQARSSLSKQVELQVREGAGFALGERTLTLAPDGLTLSTPQGIERFPAQALSCVTRDKTHFFVLTHDRHALSVPFSAFQNADEAQSFYSATYALCTDDRRTGEKP